MIRQNSDAARKAELRQQGEFKLTITLESKCED